MRRSPPITAADIAAALGGHRTGRGYTCRCPAHDDHSPSLSIADSADGADSRLLVHCHAGCTQQAVIAALRSKGLWPERSWRAPFVRKVRSTPKVDSDSDSDDESRRAYAMQLWSESIPIAATIAETYLRARGITMELPPSLGFHERLKHTPTGSVWPAMVGLVTDGVTATPLAVHRTYISPDGSGKAPVAHSKMSLGRVKGGVVRLAETIDELMVAEGIETALSLQQACGIPAWAGLSANGIKSLNLPPGIQVLTICADGDPTGEAAAVAAARRLRLTVRTVRVVRAPADLDFNDVLNSTQSTKGDGHD